MTDTEIICEWMETRPTYPPGFQNPNSPLGWWTRRYHYAPHEPYVWVSCNLTSDRLYLVEERLTDKQWRIYRNWFIIDHQIHALGSPFGTYLLHATAEQKIRALASTLRAKKDGK